MEFGIDLPKELIYKGYSNQSITLNIPKPQHVKWSLVEKTIPSEMLGIYVVFDKVAEDEDDWFTPNPLNNLHERNRRCLYVGEGQIRNRLTNKKNKYRPYAGEVIYYEVPNIEDRKLFERLLIKHFRPIFNKDGFALPHQALKKYWRDRDKLEKSVVSNIAETLKDMERPAEGKVLFDYIYTKYNWPLNYINEVINQASACNNHQQALANNPAFQDYLEILEEFDFDTYYKTLQPKPKKASKPKSRKKSNKRRKKK
ncbi:hypothetical protein WAX78_14580 [Bacillus sp. FJAT-53711]|uniref:GIY-YIG nuclease family protein n=1 Tax=Bacillus yunxiaonensis TaxID=3127665 RepID=A0ABU8FXR1_9BACI